MKRKNLIRAVAITASVLFISTPAEANMALPMVFASWGGVVAALVPVIAVETFILAPWFGLGFWASAGTVSVANLVSTLLGVPISIAALKIAMPNVKLLWEAGKADFFLMIVAFFIGSWLSELLTYSFLMEGGSSGDLNNGVLLANTASYGFLAAYIVVACVLGRLGGDALFGSAMVVLFSPIIIGIVIPIIGIVKTVELGKTAWVKTVGKPVEWREWDPPVLPGILWGGPIKVAFFYSLAVFGGDIYFGTASEYFGTAIKIAIVVLAFLCVLQLVMFVPWFAYWVASSIWDTLTLPKMKQTQQAIREQANDFQAPEEPSVSIAANQRLWQVGNTSAKQGMKSFKAAEIDITRPRLALIQGQSQEAEMAEVRNDLDDRLTETEAIQPKRAATGS